MKKKLILIIVSLLAVTLFLTACNETYKQDALATDLSDMTVSSNGGLAVKVGKYLYYINGYAGQDVDNVFGTVQKGAIARVELDQNGNPVDNSNVVVVPKNVYSTVKTSGLYVVGEYIYYSTPSIEKNSSGEPKTSEMNLMRTKLDGTDTKLIAKFKDYTPVYKVVNGYVLYVNSDNELHAIDLNSKKMTDTKIDEEFTSYYMTPYEDGVNSFIDSVFYIKSSENKNESHSVIWCYRAGGAPVKVIEGNLNSYASLEHPAGYTMTIAESEYIGDKLRLIYTKTDSGFSTRSKGTYSYDFAADLAFDATKEVRYSWDSNYTSFYFLNDENIIALSSTNVVLLKKDGDRYNSSNLIVQSSAPTVFQIYKRETAVEVYYIASNILYKIQVLDREGENYSVAIKGSTEVFGANYNTTWLTLDLVGNNLYFFNKNVKDNTYYLNLNAVIDRDADSKVPVLLGLVTVEDEIALLTTEESTAS